MSLLLYNIEPFSGSYTLDKRSNNVVFPDPTYPIIPSVLPSSISRLNESKTLMPVL